MHSNDLHTCQDHMAQIEESLADKVNARHESIINPISSEYYEVKKSGVFLDGRKYLFGVKNKNC